MARRPARPLWWVAGGVVALLALAVVALPHAVWLRASTPEFSADAAVSLPTYGAQGTQVPVYEHGRALSMRTAVTNRSPVPVTVVDVRFTDEPEPLVETVSVRPEGGELPFTLWPGQTVEVEVAARFGNCRHYHEREVQVMDGLRVDTETAGRRSTHTVALDQRLLVHAPMLVGCPDRTVDRGDDARR